jgi:hypothetical protein
VLVPLLLVALVATLALAWGAGAGAATGAVDGGWVVVARNGAGEEVARVPLPGSRFAVSYRNSIYKTLAEERYRVREDGSFAVVQIAADQLAVLEEYYAVPLAPEPAPSGDRRNWVVPPDPAHPAVFDQLSIFATDLGERTLHVPGRAPVELYRLVHADPTIVLDNAETP